MQFCNVPSDGSWFAFTDQYLIFSTLMEYVLPCQLSRPVMLPKSLAVWFVQFAVNRKQGKVLTCFAFMVRFVLLGVCLTVRSVPSAYGNFILVAN